MGDRTTCTESDSRAARADGAVPRADDAGPDLGDGGGCTGGGARLPAVPARPLPAAAHPRRAPGRHPSHGGAAAAGATALLVVLLLGGVAGEAGGITGIALGLVLFAVLVATGRPWRYVLPHFLAGLWIIGFASAAFQDALLLTRGEWVSAVVTRDLHARTGPRCDLTDLRGRALPPTTTGCGSHGTGDRVRVLADPLRLVPSRFASPPVRDACLTWGAAGAVHVAAGAAAGYGTRRGGRGPGGSRASRSST
ncbi:hypothetical protein [Streptomyces sp. OUCMDZ-3434]|uniref:hypothetical protein n=1 Tax=Streptomyces sp. OUCMDZ-3434 TaxID=1535304 RepID=UPI001E29699D|nr:hypothetical protein [Streptomyces sp. OUCMDZ-3434]